MLLLCCPGPLKRRTRLFSHTSIDPLGLTPLGEQLSVELIPGVRERQTHPRYLTAIAVSHAVCDDFPGDTLASDEVSEPWQVFEWYVVEGLVRSAASTQGRYRGAPPQCAGRFGPPTR